VWTPRRVLLLLAGTLMFGGVYGVYAHALGWIDGLPQLPARMLEHARGEFRPPDRPLLPTVERLRVAFGPGCEEENPSTYANQFTFRSGDSWVVVATGRVPNPDGTRVVLSPFSVAVFGKPRPAHLRAPGEVEEISTFHADKAVLEFDRPVSGLADMHKAKVVRLELASDPEATTRDKRRGQVHITNNQRSADPNKALAFRSPGPVFYRDPKGAGPKAAGPDVWTDAAVEVVDRQNLPRPLGDPAPPTAPARGEELRAPGAVPDILAARRFPPPTVTAVGMKVYLEDSAANKPAPQAGPPAAGQAAKKGSAGFSGVRRLELGEKVLLNLWVDSRQSVVATPGDAAGGQGTAASPLGVRDEPSAAAAALGGLFTAAQHVRRLDRALLQIETLGPFAYDAEKNVARFDVVPQAEASVHDYVQVHRLPPRGKDKAQHLFSQVLEVEFFGPLAGADGKAAEPPAGGKAAEPAGRSTGPSFKRLHAWTYTPGRLVMVSSEEDRLDAFGFDLVHDQEKNATTLKGAPVQAVRANEPRADGKAAGRNELTAGAAGRPASLTMTTSTTATPAGPVKATTVVVDGAGGMKLYDPNSGANTVEATWADSLTHTREVVQQREMDLLTFTGAALFEDRKAEFWLKGNVLKLWVEAKGQAGGQPLPHRVQALGDVASHSTDFDIERSDHLNVLFEDGTFQPTPRRDPAPPVAAAPAAPTPAPAAGPAPAPGPVAAVPLPKEEPRPKPPMRIRARVINTRVVRAAVKSDMVGLDPPGTKMPGLSPSDPASRPPAGGTKYHLRSALCEGSDTAKNAPLPLAHQDPTDPAKPRGLDIFGATLHLDQTPDGGVLTVTGEAGRPGEVHHEGMSVLGPKVVIDQLHNRLTVEGSGSLAMPAGSTLSGAEPPPPPRPQAGRAPAEVPPPPPVVVHWRDEMKFEGAAKWAEFVGRVKATQGETFVVCHTLQVQFDKPVAFNPSRPAAAPAGKGGGPRNDAKIEKVMCYPAPEDSPDEPRTARNVEYTEATRDPAGRLVKWQYIKARELEMTARAVESAGKEPYNQVIGTGPGVVRIWQYGEKDVTRAPGPRPASGAAGPRPTTPGARPPAPPEGEMKLTVVTFTGRMTAKDKGKLYQEAVFQSDQRGGGPIEVVHAPAADPGVEVSPANPPPGTVRLTCADRLVVATHRPENAPVAQRMDAYGNVFIRSDEYDGWGETVNSDGRYVTLTAGGTARARINHRFNGSNNSGHKIVYDRVTGDFRVDGSTGATFQSFGR
jgi:hypothetical protein